MRSWILFVLMTGCCADTYEIDVDRTAQPVAEITFQGGSTPSSTESGDLRMQSETGGYTASLYVPGRFSIVLHIPSTMSGT